MCWQLLLFKQSHYNLYVTHYCILYIKTQLACDVCKAKLEDQGVSIKQPPPPT